MTVSETSDRSRVTQIFEDDPISYLEILDENQRGIDGLVSVFTPDGEHEALTSVCALGIRWGQKALGLGSKAALRAKQVGQLARLLEALPDQGRLELCMPFWAAGPVGSAFQVVAVSPVGIYVRDIHAKSSQQLSPPSLSFGGEGPANGDGVGSRDDGRSEAGRSRARARCVLLSPDDAEIIHPMFPKRVPGSPASVLAFGRDLVAVAAVTHQYGHAFRISVYTVESYRGRGFGGAVLSHLTEACARWGETPSKATKATAVVDMSNEVQVRLVERAGFVQHEVLLRAEILGRREALSIVTP